MTEEEGEEEQEKTVYFVAPDRLGWSWVAENEEKAREYASEDPDIFDAEACEVMQMTDDDGEPVTMPEHDFGYKVPLEEGLRKRAYDWAEYEIECEECGELTEFVYGEDGKIVCEKCADRIKTWDEEEE